MTVHMVTASVLRELLTLGRKAVASSEFQVLDRVRLRKEQPLRDRWFARHTGTIIQVVTNPDIAYALQGQSQSPTRSSARFTYTNSAPA